MTRHDTHHTTRQASSSERSQAVIGLTLIHEQFPIMQLVELGVQTEQTRLARSGPTITLSAGPDNLVRIVLDFSCRGSM